MTEQAIDAATEPPAVAEPLTAPRLRSRHRQQANPHERGMVRKGSTSNSHRPVSDETILKAAPKSSSTARKALTLAV